MKFSIHHLAILSLSTLLFAAGCGNNNAVNSTASNASNASGTAEVATLPEASKLNIKVSFYPIYEFTKNVAGDLAEVEALIPAGIEPHDWEPTAQDMAEISDADMLIYNGAGMEGWVDQVLESVSGTSLITVEASKGLDIIKGTEEEEADHDHEEGEHVHEEGEHVHEEGEHVHEEGGHVHEEGEHVHEEGEHAHDEHSHNHDHGGLDPHVWLSPVLAIQEVRNIEAALSAAAPDKAKEFKANADAYVAKLEQLDQAFKDGLKETKRKDFITQHAAFGYLAKQYGLTQVPIAGLSPEQEPSAANMSKIVEFAKEHKVKTIFFETLVSSSVADTIAKEIGAKAAVLNPIEGLTEEDLSQNSDYLGIMRQNLEALKSALNE